MKNFNLDFLATKIMTTRILFVTCLGVLWMAACEPVAGTLRSYDIHRL